MGEGLLLFYQTKLKKEYKYAFLSTFFIGMLIHLYKFANTLPNHDSVYNYYTNQNILDLGRWALSWSCGISSYWDLPWVIGILSCVFIALTTAIIVALFKLKNPILIGLIGALLTASPATTETFFFLYTADGYMIAMFLAALAVYLSRIEETRKCCIAFSCVCICVSCGIYQAYVSFALILAICYFIDILFQGKYDRQTCFKWALQQGIIYTASLAAYYAIWKLSMHFTNTVVKSYQGISDIGKISACDFIDGFIKSIKSVIIYFLQWNVFEHGFTFYSVINIIFLVVMVAGILIAFIKSNIRTRKWAIVLTSLCLMAIVPFSGIWNFASANVGYRPMMLQCLTLLFVLVAVLYERWADQITKDAVCLLLVLIIFNNALMANISYFYMNLCYERTYAEGIEMISEIHNLQDEYDIKNIAILGSRLDDVQWPTTDYETGKIAPAGKIHMLSMMLEESLLYDSIHTTLFLRTTFGLDLPESDTNQINLLLDTDDVRNMGCWPSGDSIKVIDNTLVIKYSD